VNGGDTKRRGFPALFDIVCCVSLDRRRDRWQRFQGRVPADWPFQKVLQAEAIDGQRCPPPPWWTESAGAWGCSRSHYRVIEQALNSGADSLLVFEDDAVFSKNFVADVREFFEHLPDDWQMVYLGGQLLKVHFRPPAKVNDWVYRPFNVNRTHAYAVRGEMLEVLYRWLNEPRWYGGHIVDHHIGRLHETGDYQVYVPRRWLVGQAAGPSDITGKTNPTAFWRNPEDDANRTPSPLVVVLGDIGSPAMGRAITELEQNGVYFGADSTDPANRPQHGDPALAALCDAQQRGAYNRSILPAEAAEELKDRLSDWLGHYLWQAECRKKTAGTLRPQFATWLDHLAEFCGPALRVIRVEK
jgi:hypothetical protein